MLSGGAPMTPRIALKTLKLLREANLDELQIPEKESVQLSKREIEILTQLSKGLNYNQIAENHFISPSTVRKHIENIYKKLQVHSKTEAMLKAKNQNII